MIFRISDIKLYLHFLFYIQISIMFFFIIFGSFIWLLLEVFELKYSTEYFETKNLYLRILTFILITVNISNIGVK